MCPSTEPTESQREFAADVLQNRLRRIAENNNGGRYTFLVSHAWTEGSTIFLVYTAPPSDITWGLVRDTRESLIDPGPWNTADDPALYYYLLDLEGIQPTGSSSHPGGPDTIAWLGDQREGLPERLSDIPESYRHTPPPISAAETRQETPPVIEPRWYANPL
ncbi:hypothetical protein MSIMFB_04678 [Mycobacterium simulans]|uniref:Uncharacterized protein n=1 Tax=Mycobacterium simulans TaxID=627089 RepID=A0A7Z7NBR8_9MYCO|nr:hypothetical protein [Mycobacterium simulans]SOJ57201.1 hypothetical protein MSIMFB_04678 [Mycobacterium simulans]